MCEPGIVSTPVSTAFPASSEPLRETSNEIFWLKIFVCLKKPLK